MPAELTRISIFRPSSVNASKNRRSRSSRSARHWSGLCLTLLVESLRRAGRLTVAMDSRGYSAPGPRTWLGEAPWTRSDTLVLLGAAVIATVPHLVRLLG